MPSTGSRTGRPARLALDTADGAYALVLLDLGLPRKSGLDLLKEVRRAGNKVRVLIVTARDAVADRVAGLDAGADDYLVKPFSLDELAARMRALLRRDVAREDNVLRNGDLALDPAARTVTRDGAPVDLSGARVRAAGRAARAAGHRAVQGAAGGAPVRLGRGSGEQHGRGARPQPAQEARRRRDPHDPRRGLRDRHGHDVDPPHAARLAAAGPGRGRGAGDARHLRRDPARDRRALRPAAEAARVLDADRRPAARAAAGAAARDGRPRRRRVRDRHADLGPRRRARLLVAAGRRLAGPGHRGLFRRRAATAASGASTRTSTAATRCRSRTRSTSAARSPRRRRCARCCRSRC